MCVCARSLQSCPTLCHPWTVAHQAPLSMGFSGQDYWSGLLCPPPGDLPNPGTGPESLVSPELAGGFFTTSAAWKACVYPEKTTIPKDICTPMFTAAAAKSLQSCLTLCDPSPI